MNFALRICFFYWLLNLHTSNSTEDDGLPIWDAERWSTLTHINCLKTNWIHIPKTGSTFCLSLQHVCCPKKFENLTDGITTSALQIAEDHKHDRFFRSTFHYYSHYCYRFIRDGYEELGARNCPFTGMHDHKPLSHDPKTSTQQIMTMIRHPNTRIISAYTDAMHHEGISEPMWERTRKTQIDDIAAQETDKYAQVLKSAMLYMNMTVMHGCQTKMLLGRECASSHNLPSNAIEMATARLRNFFFVGLTEQYERSLRLFHELANMSTVPTDVELFPQRVKSTHPYYKYISAHFDEIQYSDPIDSGLYEIAKQIFEEEIAYVKRWKGIDL